MSRRIMLLALGVASVSGCATAKSGADSGDDGTDSGIQLPADAATSQPDAYVAPPAIDAGGGATPITITQSSSQTIAAANSVACQDANYYSTANSYYRVFNLSGFGITGPFSITSVDVGIEDATGATGSQSATVTLHTLSGGVAVANLSQLTARTVTVADQAATILNVPITATAPAGSTLVVEFSIPDGTVAGDSLFIGSNTAGETGPGYLVAVDCSVNDMTTTTAIGYPDMHIVMNVNGTH